MQRWYRLNFCFPGTFRSLRPRQNVRYFANDILKTHFLWIAIKIQLGSNLQLFSIGSNNGLVPNRWQTIIWRLYTRPQLVNMWTLYLSVYGLLWGNCAKNLFDDRKCIWHTLRPFQQHVHFTPCGHVITTKSGHMTWQHKWHRSMCLLRAYSSNDAN